MTTSALAMLGLTIGAAMGVMTRESLLAASSLCKKAATG